MVNIFGDSTGKVGPAGPPGPAGAGGGLKEMIQWFPQMILEQTRKKLNSLTLLIETIPPAKNADVELTSKNRITMWKPFNDHKINYFLKPVDCAGEMKSLMPEENRQRYGMVFRKEEEIMYYMKNCPSTLLTLSGAQVFMTMTFLVGQFIEQNEHESNEEFILSDYRWLAHKPTEIFRGVSIIPKADNKFDLYLHGAIGENAVNFSHTC